MKYNFDEVRVFMANCSIQLKFIIKNLYVIRWTWLESL